MCIPTVGPASDKAPKWGVAVRTVSEGSVLCVLVSTRFYTVVGVISCFSAKHCMGSQLKLKRERQWGSGGWRGILMGSNNGAIRGKQGDLQHASLVTYIYLCRCVFFFHLYPFAWQIRMLQLIPVIFFVADVGAFVSSSTTITLALCKKVFNCAAFAGAISCVCRNVTQLLHITVELK